MEQEPILNEHNLAESESRANPICFAEPKQGHELNAHNKQEYPPMHTDEIDTPLKKPSVLKRQLIGLLNIGGESIVYWSCKRLSSFLQCLCLLVDGLKM